MRCLDEKELKIVAGAGLKDHLPLSMAVVASGAVSIGAIGCVAGGITGPGGVLIGCTLGAAFGLVGGAMHYLVASNLAQ